MLKIIFDRTTQKMNLKVHLFIILLTTCYNSGYSQNNYHIDKETHSIPSVRLGYSPMRVIATNDFLRTKNKNESPITQGNTFAAEIVFQTTGRKYWHQLYNFPKFGFGINSMSFPQTDELGSPISLYSFLESPIFKWKNSQINWVFNFGMALGWNAYDSISNPYNQLIGSSGSVYANFSIIYHQNLTQRLGAEASIGFTHSSNGALKMPNYGINIFAPRLSLTYCLNDYKAEQRVRKLPDLDPTNEISLTYSLGTKQIDVSGSKNDSIVNLFRHENFTVYNFVLLYQRQVSRLSKVGAGIDFTVDPSDNAHGLISGNELAPYPPSFNQKAKVALVLSYELAIGKLALVLQPGFYLYRTTYDPTPFFYQRIGTRYDLYKGFYAGASLRAVNFGQADWIEFSIGYKVKF